MPDVAVTVPQARWDAWMAEGDGVGEPRQEEYEYHWTLRGRPPKIQPGERVYIVARGKLRGYAPLVRLERNCDEHGGYCLVREGDAVAVTLRCLACQGRRTILGVPSLDVGYQQVRCPRCAGAGIESIKGFRGPRYAWWERSAEIAFLLWRQP